MDQIKSFKANIDDIKRDQGIVVIAISKFDQEDGAEDIVRKGAFSSSFADMSRIKHCTDHRLDLDHVIGTPRKAWETDQYALVESKLILGKAAGHDAFEYYKHFADENRDVEHSYRYQIMRKNHNTAIAGNDIAELRLKHEYSTVFAGCNPFTPALEVKSMYSIDDIVAYHEELMSILRKCDLSDAGGQKIESLVSGLKKALTELDKQKPDNDSEIIKIVKETLFN